MPQQSMRIQRYPQKINQKTTPRRKPLYVILSLFLMICIGLYGCGTMQVKDYPRSSAATLGNAVTKNNLCIAARAVTDKKDLEQYFGTDLTELKILPVYIVAENRNISSSFLLSNDYISLQHTSGLEGAKHGDRSVSGKSPGGAATAMAGGASLLLVPLAAPALLFTGLKAVSDASVIKQNLASKTLYTGTISPGKSTDGFVYFTLPGEGGTLKDWTISVKVKELGTDETQQFTLTLE